MDDVEVIGLLSDPLRRRLYDFVVGQHREVSRSEAADATGAKRSLVAFHLDKLVDAGLLVATERRVNGRSGPGAGRPAKLYRRSDAEHRVSLPARDHGTLAELLADAAEMARLDEALYEAARRHGEAVAGSASTDATTSDATTTDEALTLLEARGYEPYLDGEVIRMRNCPFHPLAERHPGMICGMNLALLEGLFGATPTWHARLDPLPDGGCCVTLESKNNQD